MPSNTVSPSLVVTPSGVQTYTALYLVPGGCLITQTVTVSQPPPIDVAVNGSYLYCTNGGPPAVIGATAYPQNYPATFTWQPGNMVGPSQLVTPSVTTTYTVFATIGGCPAQPWMLTVNVSSACCSQTYATLSGTLTAGGTITGPKVILNDIVIGGNTMTQWIGEFVFAPNVKVTVAPGNEFRLTVAHLYACGTNMWEGIKVQDGSNIVCIRNGTLPAFIEDAKTAIELPNVSPAHPSLPIESTGTIFNKNHVAIHVNTGSVTSLLLYIVENVFTN